MIAVAGEPVNEDFLIFGAMPITYVVAAATLALVGVSLVTQPPPREVVERFFPRPSAAEQG